MLSVQRKKSSAFIVMISVSLVLVPGAVGPAGAVQAWVVAASDVVVDDVTSGTDCDAPELGAESVGDGAVLVDFDGRAARIEHIAEFPVGTVFAVKVDENSTTGYMWDYHITGSSPCVVRFGDSTTESDTPGGLLGRGGQPLLGAGHILVLRFRAMREGTTSITMRYQRPWELGTIAKQIVLHVRIT
jgi:predicted secreted protein